MAVHIQSRFTINIMCRFISQLMAGSILLLVRRTRVRRTLLLVISPYVAGPGLVILRFPGGALPRQMPETTWAFYGTERDASRVQKKKKKKKKNGPCAEKRTKKEGVVVVRIWIQQHKWNVNFLKKIDIKKETERVHSYVLLHFTDQKMCWSTHISSTCKENIIDSWLSCKKKLHIEIIFLPQIKRNTYLSTIYCFNCTCVIVSDHQRFEALTFLCRYYVNTCVLSGWLYRLGVKEYRERL